MIQGIRNFNGLLLQIWIIVEYSVHVTENVEEFKCKLMFQVSCNPRQTETETSLFYVLLVILVILVPRYHR